MQLIETNIIRYNSVVTGERTVHAQGLSPVEAVDTARDLPNSQIEKLVIDLSCNPPKVISCEPWEA